MNQEFHEALHRLLDSDTPGQELRIQHHSGLLKQYLPEVDRMYGVPQRAEFHPEIDVGWHMELCLNQAHAKGYDKSVKFAVLMHDLGKGITPADILPRHHDHERTGIPLVKAVCARLGVDEWSTKLALLVCEYHLWLHKIFTHRSETISRLVHNKFKDHHEGFVRQFTQACFADATGRLGKQNDTYAQAAFFVAVQRKLAPMEMWRDTPGDDPDQVRIYRERLAAIRFLRKVHDTNITNTEQKATA